MNSLDLLRLTYIPTLVGGKINSFMPKYKWLRHRNRTKDAQFMLYVMYSSDGSLCPLQIGELRSPRHSDIIDFLFDHNGRSEVYIVPFAVKSISGHFQKQISFLSSSAAQHFLRLSWIYFLRFILYLHEWSICHSCEHLLKKDANAYFTYTSSYMVILEETFLSNLLLLPLALWRIFARGQSWTG